MKSNASKSTAFSVWWYRWSGKNAFMRLTGFFSKRMSTRRDDALRQQIAVESERKKREINDEYRYLWSRRNKWTVFAVCEPRWISHEMKKKNKTLSVNWVFITQPNIGFSLCCYDHSMTHFICVKATLALNVNEKFILFLFSWNQFTLFAIWKPSIAVHWVNWCSSTNIITTKIEWQPREKRTS